MERRDEEYLLRWLQTFELTGRHSTLAELSDGVAVAQALHQIAPEWFTTAWLAKIKIQVGSNWRLKVSNLKKIAEGIVDYYEELLDLKLPDIVKPDVANIGGKSDASELGKLLQLVLGCAVNCTRKQDYITRIMAMGEAVQQVIMQSIQELDASIEQSSTSRLATDPTITRLLSDFDLVTQSRNQMARRCNELEVQVTLLQEEKAAIVKENERLQKSLRAFEMTEDSGSCGFRQHACSASHPCRQQELERQLRTLKKDKFVLEASRDDYRLKCTFYQRELREVQTKTAELQREVDKAQFLKVSVRTLREKADKVEEYEATISNYKKILDEYRYRHTKRQMKLSKEKNIFDEMKWQMKLSKEKNIYDEMKYGVEEE